MVRVVSIAHTAVNRLAGRRRYAPLAAMADLDVHLVAPTRWRQFDRLEVADPVGDPGVTMHLMPARLQAVGAFGWYLHVYPGLPRLLHRLKPDVLHLWEEPWSAVAFEAACLRRKAALVLEVDQNILKRLPPPFEAIRRFVLRRTALILARSPDAEKVVRACGYEGPVRPIGYGVDQEIFRPDPASRLGDQRELALGYAGRLVEEKGLDDALGAMAQAQVQVSLAVMGEGAHEIRLRARARELGLAERVTFRPWGPPAEVARFLQPLDAALLLTRTTPSVREQFGRAVIEAQSCGVPMIGSRCGAIPDVVGEGGWIVPERDPSAIAALCEAILRAPDERQRRSAAALANVSARFTYEVVARGLAAAWRDAAEAAA